MPKGGVETEQVLHRRGDVADALQSTGHVEDDPPLSNGLTRAHRVANQMRELAMSHGPRGEDIPGFPPQRNGRKKIRPTMGVLQGLGPQLGGATGATGGAVAATGAVSPYHGPEYPEGVAVTSMTRGFGTYGWCWYGAWWRFAPCGGRAIP